MYDHIKAPSILRSERPFEHLRSGVLVAWDTEGDLTYNWAGLLGFCLSRGVQLWSWLYRVPWQWEETYVIRKRAGREA